MCSKNLIIAQAIILLFLPVRAGNLMSAQNVTPGGTACTTAYWLKADQLVTNQLVANGAQITRWNDAYGNAFVGTAGTTAGTAPSLKYGGMNFHPAVDFTYPGRRLTSENNFQIETPEKRIYRAFYVTKSNLTSGSGAIFSFTPNYDEGWNAATAYLYVAGTAVTNYTPAGMTRRHGIISVDRQSNTVWHNGRPSTGNTARPLINANTAAAIGTRGYNSTSHPFYGEMQEIIILSTPASIPFDPKDMQKITSYLAIKYGQTLDSIDQPRFFSSADTVWDAAIHAPFVHHVFGIARDDASGLYQKQSTNTDENTLTMFLSNSLETLNSQNTGKFVNDLTYLLLGSNNQTGTQAYIISDGTAYANRTLTDEFFSLRQNRTYKAQLTGINSLTVGLQVKKLKAKYVMVSDNINFTPASTRLYYVNPNNGIVENVEIFDGDYIGFVCAEKAPGGVTAYRTDLWLKADEVQGGDFLNNNAIVSRWENQSETMINFVSDGTIAPPVYTYNGMNFNPAVQFDNAVKRLASDVYFPIEAPANRIYRSFYVSKSKLTSGNGALFSYNTNYDEGWATAAGYWYVAGTGATNYNPGLTKRYGITGVDRSSNTVWHNAGSISGGTARPLVASANSFATIGTRGATSNANPFYGDIQEIIILSTPPGTPFDVNEMQKINSYLTIKYGQTLESAQPNLYNSAGVAVWDAGRHGTYVHNIFGIARDEMTGLFQKQSTNVDDQTLTVFLDDKLHPLSAQNQGTMRNNTYLLFGSNGLDGVTDYSYPGKAIKKRQERIYKAQLSGPERTIRVSFQIQKFKAKYVLVSNSDIFPAANTQLYPVTDGIATDILITDGDFIGFAMDETIPGGVGAYHVELWLKADDIRPGVQPDDGVHVVCWANLSGTMHNFVQNNTDATPVYRHDGMNYQPTLRFETAAKKLVSEFPYRTYAGTDRLYRTFYVTKSNIPATNNCYGSVFAFRDTYDEGWCYHTGANAANYLYYDDNTSTTVATFSIFNPGQSNRFGITSMDRSGTVWHNAKQATGSVARVIPAGSGIASIGTRGPGNNLNPYYGDIQEIIVLSTPQGTPFHQDSIAKINTYLAVKYGQSLDTVAQMQWLRSDDAIIWDVVNNTGYNHNIFGIGRDDATGLFQKQSVSVGSAEKITVFTGAHPKLPALNSLNEGDLTDGFFLLFGSNGIVSTNDNRIDYLYNEGAQFMNDTISMDLEYRHPTVLKAQLTDTSLFTVNMYAGGLRADYVLVSGDPSFPPASTRIYPVDGNYAAHDIAVHDSDYIGFAYQLKTPGGVGEDLRMWLKASEVSTIDLLNGEVQEWRDFSGNTDNIYYYYRQNTRNLRPGYLQIDPDMNYHPSVDFRPHLSGASGDREYLNTDHAPFSVASPHQYTLVSVVRLRDLSTYSFASYFIGFGGYLPDAPTRNPCYGFQTVTIGGVAKNIGRSYQSVNVDGTKHLYNTNATTAAMFITEIGANQASSYLRFEADGESDPIYNNSTVWNNRNNMSMNAAGTLGGASLYERCMIGTMSEVIAYETVLNDTGKDRIYTYLGLKFGITLNKDKSGPSISTANFDYRLSDNTLVWAGDSDPLHRRYHHNVAAIVRDDKASLNNMQSHSTDENSAILMGIGKRLGLTPELTGLESDKECIIWGNNGASFEPVSYNPNEEDRCGQMSSILQRIWMVEALTQQDYQVLIGAGDQGFNAAFPYNGGYRVTMLIAEDEPALSGETKIQNRQWERAITGHWVDGLHQFNVTLEQGKRYFFTFGGIPLAGDCKACDVEDRLSNIVFSSAAWGRGWTSRDFVLNNATGMSAHITTGFKGAGNASFETGYPRGENAGYLALSRSGNSNQKMVTTITLDEAAKASFHLRQIDYDSRAFTNVKVYGICGPAEIVPSLNYATNERNSFYTINKQAGTARADKRSSAGFFNRNAWLNVEFESPVQQIVIEHSMTGNPSVPRKYFGIGDPISFVCPAPPPPVNDAGFSMTQYASPREAYLCEEITYTYRIQNTNCESKQTDFYVQVPTGMRWVPNSLSIDTVHITDATINNYGGDSELSITDLTLPGGKTTVFRARVYFDMTAVAGDYTNRARIDYNTPTPESLYSCDEITLGCASTTVVVLPVGNRELPVEIVDFSLDNTCYKPGDEITATIIIHNPNKMPVTQAALNVAYNEGFAYKTASLSGNIPNMGVPDFGGVEEGEFILAGTNGTGFAIPTDISTISFTLIAPPVLQPDYNPDGSPRVDESSDPLYAPFSISFDFTSCKEDVCAFAAFREAYGDATVEPLPYVHILEPTEICIGDTAYLSRWTGGTWTVDNPVVASINQTDTCTCVEGLRPGKTVFYFTLSSGCVAVSDTLNIVGCITEAVDDSVMIYKNEPVTFDPPENDLFPGSERGELHTIITSNGKNGTAVINADTTFTYTPHHDFIGLDTITYSITCGGVTDTAKIFICVMQKMQKLATLNAIQHNGKYANPVTVLYNEEIEYEITAFNAHHSPVKFIITDTLPPYLSYVSGTACASFAGFDTIISRTAGTPSREIISWQWLSPNEIPAFSPVNVFFRATPESGVSASQPMFINRAWIKAGDTAIVTENCTYHQGAGVSMVSFSGNRGGQIYNAIPQAVDYKTSAGTGVLVVPDDGYVFTGWSHHIYRSKRNELISAQVGVMNYETLTIYGDVTLTANFAPETYPIRYYLNGGRFSTTSPASYTVESQTITLDAPEKAGDVFTGWTGSNGEEPQRNVTVLKGSTGERTYYANFLYSGREDPLQSVIPTENRIWAFKNELFIQTTHAGGIVRIYNLDGVLYLQHPIDFAGEAKINLPQGVYIVTIDNGAGKKVVMK